jgi:3'(2'), 5'-bisphosphate nucleotidase
MLELSELLPRLLEIAHAAGREIMDVYSREFAVAEKADRTPLTQADLRSQQKILAGLEQLTPGIPVVAEESATVPWAQRRHWRELWLVDPLDGTREFVTRNPEFTVNIALVRDHRPVLGVVHVPAQSKDYFGYVTGGHVNGGNGQAGENTEGGCAFRQKAGEAATPIRVAKRAEEPLRIVGSKSHRGDSLDALLAKVGPHVLKPIGSSLKLCLVAEGSADFYPRLGPTMEWDTAAAQAVAECAGAQVIDLQGKPLRYNAREDLLNPHFLAFADTSRNWLQYV